MSPNYDRTGVQMVLWCLYIPLDNFGHIWTRFGSHPEASGLWILIEVRILPKPEISDIGDLGTWFGNLTDFRVFCGSKRVWYTETNVWNRPGFFSEP